MSNTFTKNYQDGQALTEAKLDTAFQTVQPDLSNLALSTTGSTSGEILQSQGSNVSPDYVSLNAVINATSISSTAANSILAAANAITSSVIPTAGFANAVQTAATRTTGSSVGAGGIALSTAINFTTSSTTAVDVTNASVSITTNGNPVRLKLVPTSGTITTGYIKISCATTSSNIGLNVLLVRGTATVAQTILAYALPGLQTNDSVNIDPGIEYLDMPAAGTYTYKLQARITSGANTATAQFWDVKLMAYEL